MDRHSNGLLGEEMAAKYLRKKGFKVVDARYHSTFGEIDLVAIKGKLVAFVEVKLLKNDSYAKAFESVDGRKQEKIRKTALCWMAAYDKDYDYRFDVVEIYLENGQLNYMENAF